MNNRKDLKIGEVLLQTGVIEKAQIEQALTLQKGKNKHLGKVIAELGYVTEKQLAEALAKQLSLPIVNLDEFSKIPDKVKALVPRDIAEEKIIMPIKIEDGTLTLAMANPLDLQTIDNISFKTGLNILPAISFETNLLRTIEKNYGTENEVSDLLKDMSLDEKVEFVKVHTKQEHQINIQALFKSSEAPPIIKLVTMIIVDATKCKASDIHIEPREKQVYVRYRIDGELRDISKFSRKIQDSVISRIKIISDLDIINRRLPQDGRSQLKLKNKLIDLRVSTLPSIYGEKIVIRILDSTTGLMPLAKLGIPKTTLINLINTISQPQGLLLVTGPTGSGKTTTLYACLKNLRSETENIITIENPVEYKLEGITQVGINNAVDFTFLTALRSILRQDPDIIMVGEIRDKETAEIAIRASLTGHFVLSTLHTNDTVSTVTRLIDIGVPKFLLSSALSGVVSQRLVKKICENCKTEVDPPSNLSFGNSLKITRTYRGKGCQRCGSRGYYGREAVYEFLIVSRKIKNMIAKDFSEGELWRVMEEEGTKTLFGNALEKVNNGITTIEEVLAKIPIQDHERTNVST